jgi:hypothetical protein
MTGEVRGGHDGCVGLCGMAGGWFFVGWVVFGFLAHLVCGVAHLSIQGFELLIFRACSDCGCGSTK